MTTESESKVLYRQFHVDDPVDVSPDMGVTDVIKQTQKKIAEQHKDCSTFWASILSSERDRGLLRQFNEATNTDNMRVWRWRERKSFPLSLDEIAPATDFIYAAIPFSQRKQILDYSVHYMWMGKRFEESYPLLPNLFGHFLSTLPLDVCAQALSGQSDAAFQDKDGATVLDQLFFDRLKALIGDIGTNAFATLAMTPYTAVRMPLRTILLSATEEETRWAEIRSIKVTTVMYLAHLFHLPMDYFCRVDYVSDTVESAVFVSPTGTEYHLDCEKADCVSLLAQFVALPRSAQIQVLSELAAQ